MLDIFPQSIKAIHNGCVLRKELEVPTMGILLLDIIPLQVFIKGKYFSNEYTWDLFQMFYEDKFIRVFHVCLRMSTMEKVGSN